MNQITPPLLAILLLLPLVASANERYIYECKFEPDKYGGDRGRITVEWTDYDITVAGEYAVAYELRQNREDATGDHEFLFKPEAYVTYDNDYTKKRPPFFVLRGNLVVVSDQGRILIFILLPFCACVTPEITYVVSHRKLPSSKAP